jgi:hypothetical protein
MKARTKWIVAITYALAIFSAFGYYVSQSFRTTFGVAASIAEVPKIGEFLPKNFNLRDIRFQSYGTDGAILLSANARQKHFDAVISHWKTSAVSYESGFRYPGPEVEADFRPKGDRVYVGTTAVPAGSRQTGSVYFEPEGSGERGVLYIHILH